MKSTYMFANVVFCFCFPYESWTSHAYISLWCGRLSGSGRRGVDARREPGHSRRHCRGSSFCPCAESPALRADHQAQGGSLVLPLPCPPPAPPCVPKALPLALADPPTRPGQWPELMGGGAEMCSRQAGMSLESGDSG